MKQVQSCDFCGGDATGVYEPYPPALPDSPRLLLCDGCRDRLERVVQPLVAAIDGPAADDGGAAGSPASPSTGSSTTGSAAEGAGDDAGDPDDADVANVATATGSEDTVEAGGRPVTDRRGTPPGYRKVMRFLENRELPVERAEAERLAAEAYDLEPEAVTDIIDHAVGHDRLREVGDELKR